MNRDDLNAKRLIRSNIKFKKEFGFCISEFDERSKFVVSRWFFATAARLLIDELI